MKSVPEGFVEIPIPDRFVQLSGPLLAKPEPDGMRVGLLLEEKHGNPMGIAHGGLLVTVADMVMGLGSGFVTGIRWPHPTITLNCDFVRGARLGHWLGARPSSPAAPSISALSHWSFATARPCSTPGVFRVPDLERVPEQFRPPKAT